jgi:transcriptional regulator with XRE-family HTH domain
MRAGLTIVVAAQRSGYSPGYISQVERDLANPSLGTLKRIASALDVPLPLFFQGEATETGETPGTVEIGRPPARVVRADRRKTLIYPGSHIHHQLLSPDLHGRLEAIFVSAPEGTGSGDEPYVHEGEEVGLVLRGQAECRVGEEVFVLAAGDAITLTSTVPHSWRNAGSDMLEMIWISTPPTF